MLTQAVQFFNNRGTLASIQKAGCDIEADQAKANKHVVEALKTVAKWVAKLPPALLTTPALQAALVSPVPGSPALGSPAPGSLALEVQVILRRSFREGRGARQGTKRRQTHVNAEDLVQAQILGEIEAIQLVEPVLGRGKRVRISRKQ